MPFVSDTFTDTAGTALQSHTGETGATWTRHPINASGSAVITDFNRVRGNGSGNNVYYASGAPAAADYTVSADVVVISNPSVTTGVLARMDTSATTWYSLTTNGAAWSLFKAIAGSFTSLGSVNATPSAGVTYSITLDVSGTSIKGRIKRSSDNNWLASDGSWQATQTDALSATDSAVSSAGKVGFWASGANTNSTGPHIDNFSALDAGAASFTATPSTIPANHNGDITLDLAGDGTSWATGGSQFTVSGVTGIAKVSEDVTDTDTATLTISLPDVLGTDPAGSTGTLTVSDGTQTANVTVAAPTLGVSPASGSTDTTPSLNLTGVNTIWDSETAPGLFTVSGGTGSSIGDPAVADDTSASATLTVGTAAGTLTITDTSTGATADFTATQAAQTIDVTDTDLFFSPYNWYSDGVGALQSNNVKGSSTYARTSNPGAYLKFKVTTPASGTVKLNLDTTMLQTLTAANCPRLAVSIDGGDFTSYLLAYSASAVQTTIGSSLSAATHTFVVEFQGVTQNSSSAMGDRWNDSATGSSVVKITGLEIDGDATMASPTTFAKNMIVYGDSITEGADANGSSNGAGQQDATVTWARMLAYALGAEVGIIGWSAAGYVTDGYGNVPMLYNATDSLQHWNKHFSGQSRLVSGAFSPAPDYIVCNHGKNDAGASGVTAALEAWLDDVRAAAADAEIFIIVTFDHTSASVINAATLPDDNCHRVDLGSITEVDKLWSDDNIHPNKRGHGFLGALTTKSIEATLAAGAPSGTGGLRVIGG